MQSRMDKYQTSSDIKFERSKKNTKLYDEVYDDVYKNADYQNMEVIDSAKEINLNRLKDILDDKYDTRQYRTFKNYDIEDLDIEQKPIFKTERQRSYDINEIINDAKSKRAFIEEAKEKQKHIDLFDNRSSKYEKEYKELKNEEKELEELINTMAINRKNEDTNEALDMFEDLKGSENTVVTNPIETSFDNAENMVKTGTVTNDIEKTLIKADKTFYTDSNMFTKNDFEDFSTLTRQLKRSSRSKKVIIILIVLALLGVISYFVITKYVLK